MMKTESKEENNEEIRARFQSKKIILFFFVKKRLGFQLFSHVISFPFGLNYKYD